MNTEEILKTLNLEEIDEETRRVVGITLQAFDKFAGADKLMDKDEFVKMLDEGHYVNNKFERQKAFEFCDTNADGMISRCEFVAAVVRVDPRDIWRRFFNDFDKNRDGTISDKELQEAMKKLRDYDYDTSTINRYIDKHDRNKDGKLEYNEFIDIFANAGKKA